MSKDTTRPRRLEPATRDQRARRREPITTQIASFVDLFVWLLVLKSFFLPLFIIPTGSMAETLYGAHAIHTCPNCGYEYPVGPVRFLDRYGNQHEKDPDLIQCPNCRWREITRSPSNLAGAPLERQAGDRIVVHGWPHEIGGRFALQRWDVVVFKNPSEPAVNFIKRLIGLPGETIEIIDGDVFVTPVGEDQPRVARKTRQAQRALWFPFYNHDYPAPEPSDTSIRQGGRMALAYWPHWESDGGVAWQDLATRAPGFAGADSGRQEIRFAMHNSPDAPPMDIVDIYGYNAPVVHDNFSRVTDVRLSADVTIGEGEGYVELVVSKYEDVFYARLYAGGRLTLEHSASEAGERELFGETQVELGNHPINLALGHADYQVVVDVDGRLALASSPEQYNTSADEARHRSQKRVPSKLRIAAEHVTAQFAHVLIERDVHYTSDNGQRVVGTGTQGHPVALRSDAYFVMGDNSPASRDGRWWQADEIGPHLREKYERGEYTLGTVPADQMIGRAFFVYWPGFMPLMPGNSRVPNLLPDIGRVRWIH